MPCPGDSSSVVASRHFNWKNTNKYGLASGLVVSGLVKQTVEDETVHTFLKDFKKIFSNFKAEIYNQTDKVTISPPTYI